ncbi:small ribosomal subunit protein uS9m [Planococcus citri]|uniref:small ribosomal subunit protein uS9m n=1 Tax=Planococcus citri TaxID=170843 RepID=UPI0031F73984
MFQSAKMNKYFLPLVKHSFPRINPQSVAHYSMLDKMPTISVEAEPLIIEDRPLKNQQISRAMKHHLEKVSAWQKFMDEEKHKFEVGKRHLANMMGKSPETFTQQDINEAIEYLFPCGLFVRGARPMMKPPEKIYTGTKEASFDISGRPFHPFFYTGFPNLYQHMSDAVKVLNSLNEFEDKVITGKENGDMYSPIDMKPLRWINYKEAIKKFQEAIPPIEYGNFINTLTVMAEHPYASKFADFFSNYTHYLSVSTNRVQIDTIEVLEDGRKRVVIDDIHRRTSVVSVTAYYPGTGLFSIDGKDIHYFQDVQAKEMVLFPLIFSKMLKKVDIEARVTTFSGDMAVAGGIRYGISRCIANFVDQDMKDKMKLAGLLLLDKRTKERKKPGQWGARRKFTWKKR